MYPLWVSMVTSSISACLQKERPNGLKGSLVAFLLGVWTVKHRFLLT